MSQDISTIVRSRVLTNSAAEFLETRAEEALGVEHVGANGPQYVPVRDQFMAKRDIPNLDFNRESEEKMKQLEATLTNFCQTIKDRGFDKKLNIVLKDPKSYKTHEVLDIVGKIEKHHRDADKVKTCMGRIRKCFRFTGENHGQLQRLLGFVPNDSYGSIISAGFTIILGAAERSDTLRNDIYDVLATIPYTLQEINDLAEVHFQSAELWRRADAVFVAIFVILERIVSELTKSLAKKGVSLMFKGDKSGFQFDTAVKELEARLKEFKSQAIVCSEQRLGRVDKNVLRTRIAAENCEVMTSENGVALAAFQQQFMRFEQRYHADRIAQYEHQQRWENEQQAFIENGHTQEYELMRRESLQTNVYNNAYFFLTAHPSFDARTGQGDRLQIEQSQRDFAPTLRRDPGKQFKRNKKLVKEWLEQLQPVQTSVTEDMTTCLKSFGPLTLSEKDQIQWILISEELHTWLKSPTSIILDLEPQAHFENVENPVSFVTAFMLKSLRTHDYPMAGYFCGLRANTSMNEEVSGPVAMLASIYAQLLKQVKDKRATVDLTTLGDPKKFTTDWRNIRSLGKRIRSLIQLLDEEDCVFIILDFVVHMTGSQGDNDKAVGLILDLVNVPGVIVKILVTEIMSNSVMEDRICTTLALPDFVDGDSQEIMPSFFADDILQSIQGFEAHNSASDSSSEEESAEESGIERDYW